MARRTAKDLLHRWEGNPILTADDVPFPCNTVFNAAPVKVGDEYLLLLRVEGMQGYSVFALARSDDGYHFDIDPEPVMTPAKEEPFRSAEVKGLEDPRITYLDDTYYITYTAFGEHGARIALARTEDFRSFERVALISEPGNKDCVLFPRRVGERYVRLDRPYGHGVGNIWISYSKDLASWGDSRVLFTVRDGYWDSHRIGASSVPIETEHGWLEIYHGVVLTPAGPIYRLGVVTLDTEDPSKVLCRSHIPVLSPREPYERTGDVNNVVFASGAILEPDGQLKVYYGAADTCICVATAQMSALLERCTVRAGYTRQIVL